MEYSIDARFSNKGFGIVIHFLTTIKVVDEEEAILFHNELLAGFNRMKWEEIHLSLLRIDNNKVLSDQKYEAMNQLVLDSDETLFVEQFFLDDPDQSKSVIENYIQKVKKIGKKSVTYSSRQYEIPIRVKDLETGRRIKGEFSYLRIEHMIPKSM